MTSEAPFGRLKETRAAQQDVCDGCYWVLLEKVQQVVPLTCVPKGFPRQSSKGTLNIAPFSLLPPFLPQSPKWEDGRDLCGEANTSTSSLFSLVSNPGL